MVGGYRFGEDRRDAEAAVNSNTSPRCCTSVQQDVMWSKKLFCEALKDVQAK